MRIFWFHLVGTLAKEEKEIPDLIQDSEVVDKKENLPNPWVLRLRYDLFLSAAVLLDYFSDVVLPPKEKNYHLTALSQGEDGISIEYLFRSESTLHMLWGIRLCDTGCLQ